MANRTSSQSNVGLLTDIVRNGQLAWRLLIDRRVSLALKLIIPGLLVAYLISPIDLLPDVIPLVGQIDDLAILVLSIKLFIELCPKDVVREFRDGLTGNVSSHHTEAGSGDAVDVEYRVIE
jgi:uncharacterized membrane protein YkvA (DUF1232 family)